MGIDVGQHVFLGEVALLLVGSAGFEFTGDRELPRFPEAAVRAFPDAEVFLVVDHTGERARRLLSAETKAALSEDLLS
jgi:hypothetical protein